MNYKNITFNFILIIIPILIIEFFSSSVIYYKEKKIGILFSLFNLEKSQQIDYKINWDKLSNKIVPGVYQHKLKGDRFIEYTINSKGFRGKEFHLEKKTKLRIISFGGSTTMGMESPDNLTYPAQLEKMFKDINIDMEVLNFGFGSKSLNFIRELFFFEGVNYEPDFITIYSARNPIMYDSIGTKIKAEEVKFLQIKKINLYLINNIMTFRLMFKIYRKILSANIDTKKIISPFNEKIEHNIYYFTDQYFDTIKQIVNVANKKKIKVVLIKQAIYVEPEIQREIQNKSINELISSLQNLRENPLRSLDYNDSFWIVTISILNKHFDKFKNYENVLIVDPIDKLISSKENFEDYMHLTPKGNAIIADSIFQKIKKNLYK